MGNEESTREEVGCGGNEGGGVTDVVRMGMKELEGHRICEKYPRNAGNFIEVLWACIDNMGAIE